MEGQVVTREIKDDTITGHLGFNLSRIFVRAQTRGHPLMVLMVHDSIFCVSGVQPAPTTVHEPSGRDQTACRRGGPRVGHGCHGFCDRSVSFISQTSICGNLVDVNKQSIMTPSCWLLVYQEFKQRFVV